MRKYLILLLIVFALSINVYAEISAPTIKFTPEGGGKFIYCNNNEFIRRMDLSDDSNPNPSYIMNNTNLNKGKYTLYLSHINHTEKLKDESLSIDSADAVNEKKNDSVAEVGFDIEVDVQFKARTDTKISISSLGFEVQKPLNYYYISRLIRYEESWGCLNAVSSYMKRPIYEQGYVTKNYPDEFTPVTFEVKAGQEVWLSDFIKNYSAVGWLKPVLLLTDFEILSGNADVNIAALKSTGALKDRSHHDDRAKSGSYYRDRQYKGVADSLPKVNSNLLDYTINDSVSSGTLLPIRVSNQYIPGGNTVTKWISHLNPSDDKAARKRCVESDILGFTYYDEEKLNLYGSNVPDSEKDAFWRFDVTHSDKKTYDNTQSMFSSDNFIPNFRLDVDKYNVDSSCNLANYCVSTNYNLSVTNSGDKTRYFNYKILSTANVIVNVKDENGNYTLPYAVCKGFSDVKREDTMASVELKAHQTTNFTIEVWLPINYPGGLDNSFEIADTQTVLQFPKDEKQGNVSDPNYTGKEFYKWSGGELYISSDNATWTKVDLDDKTKDIFNGNWNNYEIKYLGGKYVVRWSAFVDTPAYYYSYLKYCSAIYFLDEDFNYLSEREFLQFPIGVTYAKGKYYTKTLKSYYSVDSNTWTPFSYDIELPMDNGRELAASMKDGEVYVSPDGNTFMQVSFLNGAQKPRYIDVLGDIYYYTFGNRLFVSRDSIYWTELPPAKTTITKISRIGSQFLINDVERIDIPDLEQNLNVGINNTVLQFDAKPIVENNRTLVPIRFILEQIGAKVEWDEQTNTATVKYKDNTVSFQMGNNMAVVNNNIKHMDVAAKQVDGRTLIPLRFLTENLGFEVTWYQDANFVYIGE